MSQPGLENSGAENPGLESASEFEGLDTCWSRIGVLGDSTCPELEKYTRCLNCPTYRNAATLLLDRPLPAGYREEWARHFATQHAAKNITLLRTSLIFRMGEEWLAVPALSVREVAPLAPQRPLPGRRDGVVLGLINLHGELVVAVSLKQLLHLPETAAPSSASGRDRMAGTPRLLVLQHKGRSVAVPVDAVHGLQRHGQEEMLPVPAGLAGGAASPERGAERGAEAEQSPGLASGYAVEILPWQGHAVGLLDPDLLFSGLERSMG